MKDFPITGLLLYFFFFPFGDDVFFAGFAFVDDFFAGFAFLDGALFLLFGDFVFPFSFPFEDDGFGAAFVDFSFCSSTNLSTVQPTLTETTSLMAFAQVIPSAIVPVVPCPA